MKRAQALLREALTLADDERAEIAGALLESLEPAPEADVETTWRQEVAARVAALEAGEVKTTPWEEIRDRFLARLSERRQGLSSPRKLSGKSTTRSKGISTGASKPPRHWCGRWIARSC